MYAVVFTNRVKKDLKLVERRGKRIAKLKTVLRMLARGEKLPRKFMDHSLTGNYQDIRECHIEPDWLLMYKIVQEKLILYAVRTGTPADLF